ncbi:MAG: ribonuclease [Erythrobacter sp.]
MPDSGPRWLVEDGIGERRALLVKDREALAAKLLWPGEMRAGDIVPARLVAKRAGKARGTARTEAGREILVDQLPWGVTEGATLTVLITRAAIAERGRLKRAQGRVVDGVPKNEAAPWPNASARVLRRFPSGLWEEAWSGASSGSITFPGGEILCSVTPAMTVIDVDGEGTPRDLALGAVPAIARAMVLFDCGGNIGIDFPSIETKADRRAVDEALGAALADFPHERTAMNGFGFVQVVARLEGPSLLDRFATSRVGMCARMALRRAEILDGAGTVLATVHPALRAKLGAEWLDELARRTGREVRVETDPGLALEAPSAQIVAP